MKAAILTIGTEICIGQITNTNVTWLASELTVLGYKVIAHSSVGDDEDFILAELQRLGNIADFVITTGGLGPTQDDITKRALCRFFDCELEFNQSVFDNIVEMFTLRGREITERNRQQALIPALSKPLKNAMGTASGLLFETKRFTLAALPGVPYEMKWIFEDSLKSLLKHKIEQSGDDIEIHQTIRTHGIFESQLVDLIGNSNQIPGITSLAYLPSFSGVRLRLTTTVKNIDEAQNNLRTALEFLKKKIGQYITVLDDTPVSQLANQYLKQSGKTVSVAESCTAGMLGAELTRYAGSSLYFVGGIIAYSNTVKVDLLNVGQKTLDEYGAVSKETALNMAKNVRVKFNSDIGLSITGIAGPDGDTELKPVGMVCFGLSTKDNTTTLMEIFPGDRDTIRQRAVAYTLNLLNNFLRES